MDGLITPTSLSQIDDFDITLVFRFLNFVVFLYYFIYFQATKNRQISLTSLPKGRTAVKSRWILKLKHKVEGLIERYKTRLVAEGFSRHGGADYDQTYPPVVKYDSLWVTLAMAAAEDL